MGKPVNLVIRPKQGLLSRLRVASAYVFPRMGAFVGGTGYDAANTGRRLQGWTPPTADINTLVFASMEALRTRSRDQVRRNQWAKNGVDSFVANCIGTGIKPQSQHPDVSLRRQIDKLWLRWTDEADADGLVDFYGLQSLVCREIMESGECLVRFRPRLPQDGLTVPLQLQGLEAEQLPVWYTQLQPNGNTVRAGIEFNLIGKRVAYHLLRTHPGDSTNPGMSSEIVPVSADYIQHLFTPIRFGQLRGQPWLAQVLVKLYELDMYDDAELVRKKVAAMFAGFVTQDAPDDVLLGETGNIDADDSDSLMAGMEPGTMQKLLPGEKMEFSTPPDVGTQYETFMRVQLRAIAAGMGITYEQLTGDLTGVNYSSIRAGLLEFRRRCEQFQHQQIVFQFCRPTWSTWIRAAILAGALKADANDLELYNVKWVPPGWAWVDPIKDVRAKVMEVRAGFTPRSDVVSEQGEDIEQVDATIAADNKRADALGLKFDSDGRDPAAGGAESAVKPSNENAIGSGGSSASASPLELELRVMQLEELVEQLSER